MFQPYYRIRFQPRNAQLDSARLIVRASDKQCLVVDIEPTGEDKSVTKIRKEAYLTRKEAEADVKRLCKQ